MNIKRCSIFLALLLIVSVAFSTIVMTASAADDDQLLFSSVASAAGAYYDSTHTEGSDKTFHDSSVSMANAGGLLGFVEEDSGLLGWTLAFSSQTSQTHNIRSFNNASEGISGESLANYARYGYALRSMGFDSTGSGTANIGRLIGGSLTMIFYVISGLSTVILQLVLGILRMCNPFTLFTSAFTGDNVWSNYFPDSNAGLANTTLGAFVGDLYKRIENISWTITIPLFYAGCIFSVWIGKAVKESSDTAFNRYKRLFIRVLFVAAGIPLLCSLYTSALNDMSGYIDKSGPVGNRLVYSTFVDFQAWCENSNLNVPLFGTEGSDIIVVKHDGLSGGSVLYSKTTPPRILCYDVNQANGHYSAISGWGRTESNEQVLKVYDDTPYAEVEKNNFYNTWEDTLAFLYRYMISEHYYASDYETFWKGKHKDEASVDWIEKGKDEDCYDNGGGEDSLEESTSGGVFENFNGAENTENFHNGTLIAGNASGGFSEGNGNTVSYTHGNGVGLSTLAMYNYLTSEFKSSSVVVYSQTNIANKFVSDAHYSVNAVGGGFLSALYVLNCIVLMMVISVLGWGYAIAMIVGNLRRTIRLLTNIPVALLGSYRTIARVVAYTLSMIIQIVGTMFMYILSIDIIVWLNSIIETAFSWLGGGTTYGVTHFNPLTIIPFSSSINAIAINPPAILLNFITPLAAIIINIWFTFNALKIRKQVIQAFDELMEQTITRLFGVDPMPSYNPKQPNSRGIMGTAASGAGVALGNRLFGGDGGSSGQTAQASLGPTKSVGEGGVKKGGIDGAEGGKDGGKIGSGGVILSKADKGRDGSASMQSGTKDGVVETSTSGIENGYRQAQGVEGYDSYDSSDPYAGGTSIDNESNSVTNAETLGRDIMSEDTAHLDEYSAFTESQSDRTLQQNQSDVFGAEYMSQTEQNRRDVVADSETSTQTQSAYGQERAGERTSQRGVQADSDAHSMQRSNVMGGNRTDADRASVQNQGQGQERGQAQRGSQGQQQRTVVAATSGPRGGKAQTGTSGDRQASQKGVQAHQAAGQHIGQADARARSQDTQVQGAGQTQGKGSAEQQTLQGQMRTDSGLKPVRSFADGNGARTNSSALGQGSVSSSSMGRGAESVRGVHGTDMNSSKQSSSSSGSVETRSTGQRTPSSGIRPIAAVNAGANSNIVGSGGSQQGVQSQSGSGNRSQTAGSRQIATANVQANSQSEQAVSMMSANNSSYQQNVAPNKPVGAQVSYGDNLQQASYVDSSLVNDNSRVVAPQPLLATNETPQDNTARFNSVPAVDSTNASNVQVQRPITKQQTQAPSNPSRNSYNRSRYTGAGISRNTRNTVPPNGSRVPSGGEGGTKITSSRKKLSDKKDKNGDL